jgi:hypothetical protein
VIALKGTPPMTDLLLLGTLLVFFVACGLYAGLCEKL